MSACVRVSGSLAPPPDPRWDARLPVLFPLKTGDSRIRNGSSWMPIYAFCGLFLRLEDHKRADLTDALFNPLEGFLAIPNRDAYATIRGFVYQAILRQVAARSIVDVSN